MSSSWSQRVVARAREFDLPALVSLLRARGYDDDEIRYMSNPDAASPGSLIERVDFGDEGGSRHVTVVLNLGLLGSQTLLPSYFMQALQSGPPDMDWGRPQSAFADFIGFFDDRLLSTLVGALFVERDPSVFRDYAASQRDAGQIAGLASPLVLHALVRDVFPEFRVRVVHERFEDVDTVHAARVGASGLDGSAVLGTRYATATDGLTVDLVVDDETDEYGRAWAAVARHRLTSILLPMLVPERVALTVRLTIVDHRSWARVEDPHSDAGSGHLGTVRLRGPAAAQTITVYRGKTGAGETRALSDRVASYFPEYDVGVVALADMAPNFPRPWPAGFAVQLRQLEPSADDRRASLVRLAQERLEREVLASLVELLDHRPMVIGLELAGDEVHHPCTTILGRGTVGRSWQRA